MAESQLLLYSMITHRHAVRQLILHRPRNLNMLMYCTPTTLSTDHSTTQKQKSPKPEQSFDP